MTARACKIRPWLDPSFVNCLERVKRRKWAKMCSRCARDFTGNWQDKYCPQCTRELEAFGEQ